MTKVSVVMSAYNAGSYLGRAIDSVLSQTLDDFELLVMNDGSTDGTLEYLNAIQDPRLKVFSQANSGKSVALNCLVAQAEGEYLVIQDADDECHPDRLRVLSDYLDAHKSMSMVFSGYALILDEVICAPRRSRLSPSKCAESIKHYSVPSLDPTMMVRLDVARCFPFDEELRIGQGLDFILKVGERHSMCVIPDVLYYYRFHYSSISKSSIKKRAYYICKTMNSARKRRGEPEVSEEEFFNDARKYLEDEDNNLSGHFTDSAYWSVDSGRRIEAVKTSVVSLIRLRNLDWSYLKPLVYTCMPKMVNRKIKFGIGA